MDTHAWAWSLARDARLSTRALDAITRAETMLVSPISFFEIGQKVRIEKWPQMAPFIDRLGALLEEQGGAIATLDPFICSSAGTLAWANRDPFDRLLAATALRRDVPIVSIDTAFDGVVTRIW